MRQMRELPKSQRPPHEPDAKPRRKHRLPNSKPNRKLPVVLKPKHVHSPCK